MNDEELLDHFAINAMNSQIDKYGITNVFTLAHTAYQLGLQMMASRERVHREWRQEEQKQKQYAERDLHELDIPVRYQNCLIDEYIYTKKRLCELTERDLKKIPNLGAKGIAYIKKALTEKGLKLKDQE